MRGQHRNQPVQRNRPRQVLLGIGAWGILGDGLFNERFQEFEPVEVEIFLRHQFEPCGSNPVQTMPFMIDTEDRESAGEILAPFERARKRPHRPLRHR